MPLGALHGGAGCLPWPCCCRNCHHDRSLGDDDAVKAAAARPTRWCHAPPGPAFAEVDPEHLFATNGITGGLALLCSLFTTAGDTVVV